MKNYIGFVNDHSGSMETHRVAALKDYNANIIAIRDAANREMLDSIVSVVGIGIGNSGRDCTRQVTISNPHVLKPMTDWPCPGGTPLYDGVGNMIELFKSLPDYDSQDVSFLVMVTTDGQEEHSTKYTQAKLTNEIKTLQSTGRWTFVFRVPKGEAHRILPLGVPLDNIQRWDTSTSKGLDQSTAATTQAVNNYFTARSAGKKSSNVFYANTSNVTTSQVRANLEDISMQVSIWHVLAMEDGSEIKTFSEKRLGNSPFLKGAAFYQLTKTEARVQDDKMVIIRDKSNGHVYFGPAARDMIGLPQTGTVRLHPSDHTAYDIFIQSTSINRKLVAGTQVLYWPKVGVGFTAADFPWLNNGQANATPALVQAAAQAISATAGVQRTHSIMPGDTIKTVTTNTVPANNPKYFPTRDYGRAQAKAAGKVLKDAGKAAGDKRWWF